jgi:MFS family permease
VARFFPQVGRAVCSVAGGNIRAPDGRRLVGQYQFVGGVADRLNVLGNRIGNRSSLEHVDWPVGPDECASAIFARRTRISQASVFLGFLSAGILLQVASGHRDGDHDYLLWAYMGLFGVAGISRLISVWMLARHSEPAVISTKRKKNPLRASFRELTSGPGGKLLLYLVAVQAAVQMSGPYFTPFMFNTLELSYAQFVALIAIAFTARIFLLPVWGRYAHQVGAMRLLWVGAWGITPLSGFWVLSQNFWWLMFVQILAGAMWAAYELAFFLLFFESIAEEKRTGMLTLYNLVNTSAWVLGSLLGGLVLFAMNTSFAGYMTIFAASSVGRCLALLLLMRIPQFEVEADEIGLRTISIRPNGASLDAPVLPSLPDQVMEEAPAQAS